MSFEAMDRRSRPAADVVITMGCGDACPLFPGKRYEDWELDDPVGKTIEEIRPIRDEIERRVRHLLDELDTHWPMSLLTGSAAHDFTGRGTCGGAEANDGRWQTASWAGWSA
jgi:hypothetical protein